MGFSELDDVEVLLVLKGNGASVDIDEVVDDGAKLKLPPLVPNGGRAVDADEEVVVGVEVGLKPLVREVNEGVVASVEEAAVVAGVVPKPPVPKGDVVVDCEKLKLPLPNGTVLTVVVEGGEVKALVPNEGVAVTVVVVVAAAAGVVPKVILPNGAEDADVIAVKGAALVVVAVVENEGVAIVVVAAAAVTEGFVNEPNIGGELPAVTVENALGVNVNAGTELLVTVVVVVEVLPNIPNGIVDDVVTVGAVVVLVANVLPPNGIVVVVTVVAVGGVLVLVVVGGGAVVLPSAGNVDIPN